MSISYPYNWSPRPYQMPVIAALERGYKRIIQVWHRRAGKDLTDFNITAREMARRPGPYWHVFPKYNQGRKAIWEGHTKTGQPYLSHIPEEHIVRKSAQQMRIETTQGGIWRVVGGDNYDSIVGSGPFGVVMSEYSLMNPSTWDYIEPMLLENDGWAIFNLTPRGENHAYDLVKMAIENPNWFVDIRAIEDTGVISQEQIAELKRSGKSQEHIDQEYYCSFEGSIEGAYFAKQMRVMQKQQRISTILFDPALDVHTFWDIGVDDYTAIVFVQFFGREIRVIDYVEGHNKGLSYYNAVIKGNERDPVTGDKIPDNVHRKFYNYYPEHHAPHDIEVREWGGDAISRKERGASMGLNFSVGHKRSDADRIEAIRAIFPQLIIDKNRCRKLINCLKQYRQEYDEKNHTFKKNPLHDWSSHGVDAFGELAFYKSEVVKGQRLNRKKSNGWTV